MIILKPCPFCGNEYINLMVTFDKTSYWCTCPECDISTKIFDSREKAIAFWNNQIQNKDVQKGFDQEEKINAYDKFFR